MASHVVDQETANRVDPAWQAAAARCQGMPPLDAHWSDWMKRLCTGAELHRLVEQYGSPVNVHCLEPFAQNIEQLYRVARETDIRFDVYFARKANKCVAYVDMAKQVGCGVDVASLEELRQTLNAGVPAERVVVTAAVKSAELLAECLAAGVVVVLDNRDEIEQVAALASEDAPARVALRLSGFSHDGQKLHSRFGLDIGEVESLITRTPILAVPDRLQIVGLHFHLDGYSAPQRVSALRQSIPRIDEIRSKGHPAAFIDAGGGIPMSYLRSQSQWLSFWQQLEAALLGKSEPITWENNGLGRFAIEGALHGRQETYPYYQQITQAQWLQSILTAEMEGQTIAEQLRRRKIELRCEPGRAVLDGCGLTAARVEFRKQASNGANLVGLSMNHTQCRTGSVDFLVDPILIRADESPEPTPPSEGYLVGAYCTEAEFLTWRKLRFPQGVAVGDLIVFPNTAGYLMHFRESRSHQLPLAKNVVLSHEPARELTLDAIDR